jgi:CDP-diacylglycerol--serine O-phosphatidyltransferase
MPICGALRLAKFNIDSTQVKSFKGLPIPANALAVISIVFAGQYSHSVVFRSFIGSPVILMVFTTILSLLMVTRIPLLSLKISNFKFKGNEGRYILIGLVLISFAIFKVMAFPLIIPLYIISSAISLLF